MANKHIDVFKAAHDTAYAASLSAADWEVALTSPDFDLLLGEFPETAERLLKDNPRARGFVPGSLGRATGNRSLLADPAAFTVVGKPIRRLHGLGVVTSLGNYVSNMTVPGMLIMRTLRSPHPHAKVVSIDDSKARALPGVVEVIHRFNLDEKENVRVSAGPPEHFLFSEEVFMVGQPIAALVATTQYAADEALRLIEVQYEVLPAVTDWREGMKASTPKQWDNKLDGTIARVQEDGIGDAAAGLAAAEVVVEVESARAFEQHMALEPTTSVIWWDNGRVVMYYTTQHAHGSRSGLAQRLGMPQGQVRVVTTGYMGSGYGYRAGIDVDEVHAALLAKRTGRPVKRTATRSEDFVTRGHRPQFHNTVKLGFQKDGTLTTIDADVIANVGARGGSAASGSWFQYQHLYNAANIGLKGTDVFTNSYFVGPYRCVSHPAATLGLEVAMDEAAYKLGIDPVELRLKNFNLTGSPFEGRPYSNPGIAATLTETAKAIDWANKWHAPRAKEVRPGVFHGIGIACHTCSHGAGTAPASGIVVVNVDGSMNVISGSNEIGPGQRTQMAMIASEASGVPFERTFITPEVDTDLTVDAGSSTGSRQTNTGGWGAYDAAIDARTQILDWGAKLFVANAKREDPPRTIEVSPDQLTIVNGEVVFKDNAELKLTLAQVVASSGGPIIGRAVHFQDPTWTRLAFATQAAEVEVDTVTGSITVTRYVAAHDVGRAINPFGLEQQIEGGVVMSLGAALTEELLLDSATGLPISDNILEYKALSIKDVPVKIDSILIEYPKEYGVFGAHGIGEPAIALAGPVISNAVYNAIGVRIASLPISRSKVLAALNSA